MKAISALLLFALAACGTDFVEPGGDDPQAADGEAIYRESCMQCHGDTGEGSVKGPQIALITSYIASLPVNPDDDEDGDTEEH